MIEIIFSYVNRLKNRLSSIIDTGETDMFGDGELGNVYYGNPDIETVPTIHTWDYEFTESAEYQTPKARYASYNNLYIDANTTLSTGLDWSTLIVKNNLYLRGTITASNTHEGNYLSTTIVPDFLPKIQMFGETNYLINEPFCITGGTGNPYFGNSATGGGFLAIYNVHAYSLSSDNTYSIDDIGGLTPYVNVNGGTNSDAIQKSGGCLIIAARNIIIAPTGKIENYGGAGTETTTAGVFFNYKMNEKSVI